MSQRVIEFPKVSVLTKERLKRLMLAKSDLDRRWNNWAQAERFLREQEAILNKLEREIDAEERAVHEAVAAGADIVD